MRRAPGPVIAVLAALITTSCSGMGSSESEAAERAALAFYQDLQRQPQQACELLAPGTVQELESSQGPCADSLGKQDVPHANSIKHVEVYGKEAMVELDQDVAFLARFRAGWRVMAAGCVPDGELHPYDCQVKGS